MPTFIQEILRWLPVTQRIQFKSLTLMRSFLNRSAQSHLQTLCTSVSSLPAWSLHSPLSCQRPYALCYCSFIHSGYFHSVSSSPQAYYSDALSTTLTTTRILTVSKLIRRTSTTASEGLAQGPCVAARVGFKPFGHKAPILPMSHHAPRNPKASLMRAPLAGTIPLPLRL